MLVLHTESSAGFGGQEIRVLGETGWLLEHGWDALIACQTDTPLHREARAAGLPAVGLRMKPLLHPRGVLALRRVIRERDATIVHTHSSVDSWLGALAGRSLGRVVVRSRHVFIPIRRHRALVYHLAHRVLTSGDAVADLVRQAGVPADKIVSVPAGVDLTRFHPGVSGASVRRELGLTSPLVGIVANIRGSKGHRHFLEAAARVLRVRSNVHFLIVGDGVAADRVRRQVAALGLQGSVVMAGFRRDIPQVMAALDVLVLPSVRTDATPQVLPQALAVGTPVVASAVGGIPELIRDGETGRLVPPGDAGTLAAAIVDLLDDAPRARRMARAGADLVRSTLSFDAMMTATTRVYQELLAPTHRSS